MNAFHNHKTERIKGIAVKLSILKKYRITIDEILNHWATDIIIDAESTRLDIWAQENIELIKTQVHRIYITVQARRLDAEQQVRNIIKMGMKLVLVAGHSSYLSDTTQNARASITHLLQKYSVTYLGVSKKMYSSLKTYIGNCKLLELQGYQRGGDHLWTYYADGDLSVEAKAYLTRRDGNGKFISRNYSQLCELLQKYKVIIYLDILNKHRYLRKLQELQQMLYV